MLANLLLRNNHELCGSKNMFSLPSPSLANHITSHIPSYLDRHHSILPSLLGSNVVGFSLAMDCIEKWSAEAWSMGILQASERAC